MATSVAVVGAGVVGLATAYALSELGATPPVYERRRPGEAQSGGEARLFRHAHADPRLARRAVESRALWDEWAEHLGVELVSRDGALVLGPAVPDRLRALAEAGVAARAVEREELAERLPLLAPYDGPALLDPRGGGIRVRAAIGALAGALDGAIRLEEAMSVRPTGHGTVEVLAGGTREEFEHVVLCAGAGTAPLARPLGLDLPVRLGAHARVTFEVAGEPPAALAALQDGSGAWGEVGVYASAQPGNSRVALGVDGAVEARPDGSLADPAGLAALAERAVAYAKRALPGLRPVPVELRHCWVTELPWGDDGLAAWEAGGVIAVAGNNLFKHAPWLGRTLARAALGEPLPDDLRPEGRLGAPP